MYMQLCMLVCVCLRVCTFVSALLSCSSHVLIKLSKFFASSCIFSIVDTLLSRFLYNTATSFYVLTSYYHIFDVTFVIKFLILHFLFLFFGTFLRFCKEFEFKY